MTVQQPQPRQPEAPLGSTRLFSPTITKSTLKSSLKKNQQRRSSTINRSLSWKISHLDLMTSKPMPTEISVDAPWDCLPASAKSMRTRNPIRAIVDPIIANIQSAENREDGKHHISLSIGDPTVAGNLPPCPVAISQAIKTLESTEQRHAAGYVNACGTPAARQAIAGFHSSDYQKVNPDQVIVGSGCSGALELVLTALLDEDSIFLVPQPGFPLYEVICKSHGAQVVHYRLDPENDWQVDLMHLQKILVKYGTRVRGMLVCNPSNPTGSVFSRSHLKSIVQTCKNFRLPIVADEVYGDLVFGANRYHPMADVAAELGPAGPQVPVITVSGIGKQYLLPGWRVGWAVFQDNVHGSLRQVQTGAKNLAQVVLGASHLAQSVVPGLLDKDNVEIQQWKEGLRKTLEHQANFLAEKLTGVKGLQVSPAGGAMYLMLRINTSQFDSSIDSDASFSKLLLEEENVFALPGACFGTDSACFRAVICAPPEVLDEAADRIRAFCNRHCEGANDDAPAENRRRSFVAKSA